VLHRVHFPAQMALVERRGPQASTDDHTVGPRDLGAVDPAINVDGAPVSAALYDAAVAALAAAGPPLALPALVNGHEAEWWDAVLADVERRLDRPVASIRVTVPGATDEVLSALRDRVTGVAA
jgi:malate synthase